MRRPVTLKTRRTHRRQPTVAGWESRFRRTPLPLVVTTYASSMSSLWTPDGEHRSVAETGSGRGRSPGSGAAGPAPAAEAALSRRRRAETGAVRKMSDRGELARIAQQIAAAPAEDVVANHCYGLFELAAIHLSQQPPQLEKARLAIDALGCSGRRAGRTPRPARQALADGLCSYGSPSCRSPRQRRPRTARRPGRTGTQARSGPGDQGSGQSSSGQRPAGKPSQLQDLRPAAFEAGATMWSARSQRSRRPVGDDDGNRGALEQLDVVVRIADRQHTRRSPAPGRRRTRARRTTCSPRAAESSGAGPRRCGRSRAPQPPAPERSLRPRAPVDEARLAAHEREGEHA